MQLERHISGRRLYLYRAAGAHLCAGEAANDLRVWNSLHSAGLSLCPRPVNSIRTRTPRDASESRLDPRRREPRYTGDFVAISLFLKSRTYETRILLHLLFASYRIRDFLLL